MAVGERDEWGRLNGGRRLGSINGCLVRARLVSEDKLSSDLYRFVDGRIVVLIKRVSFVIGDVC